MIMVTNNDAIQFLLSPKNFTIRQEKPRHLKYLNEFRTQQCLLFLEQQCQFHRPYTCFHWHFPNQKRRRPFKRPDGTFNYNPDVYCDKYDETSGSCADGDECPYAHRNAGDTERRYHPRYFKTGNCIYETMENGACVKNGLHCAFAHGPDDIRLPVYDIREVQDASSKFTVNLPASLEKERVLSEDPKWNEMFHVLACYKTELCKKPPRMCRQGYSCPFYHNGKDKRRAPDKFLYRSTPCPIVRPGDEWQDSSLCDTGDACVYCHTRTEQQFHPEIYKSTKCNDVLNSGYCPRGPFCAFAHCDTEMTIGRDFSANVQQQEQQNSSSGGGGLQSSSSLIVDSTNLSQNNNNNNNTTNNNLLLSNSATTPTTTSTAIAGAASIPCRHITSDTLGLSHAAVGGGCQNQQQQQHSLQYSTPHALNNNSSSNNSRILGTSSNYNNNTNINNSNNNNSSTSNLPPNLMSNLHSNFSNIIVPSPAQHQHQSPQQQQQAQQQISQRLPSSSHYQQQHLMNFTSPVEFNKSINATDHHGRSSHLPNSLMSNISPLSSSASSQTGSRNRRVPRCTSPRTCMWPSYNLTSAPNTDRQHFTQLPGPSNTDVRNTGVCPQLGVLSTNSISSTCSPNQNSSQFSHSRNRPVAGHLQNVAAHSLGSAAAVAAAGGSSGGGTSYPRDKGRHRSGSSMSSEIGQYSMHILRENYNSPTNTTNTTTAAYMESISSTYPGRCSSFSGGSCMSNILNKTTVTSGVGVGACGGSLSISSQKQAMSGGGGGGATSKSVLLGGRLPGICQNMPSHKSNVLWDNFESEANTNPLEQQQQQQYFSSNWPWSPPMNTGVGGGISETDNDISNFLDHCQMPLIGGGGGVCNSSSIGMRDDTSRDSGLVLDMTMPPTSPLDEQNCGGYLSGNLDSELLSQLTQSTTSQHHRISSSGLFDDIQHSGCCSRYSQDVFHSPSDDGFLSTHSASEDQDHHPSHHHPHPHHQHSVFITSGGGGCGQTNVDCSSLPNSYDSNSMMNMLSTGNNNNTNNNQDMKNIHMHSFLDSIASRSDGLQSTSSSYLQHQQLQQQQSILQSGHLMKPIRQKSGGSSSTGGWPSSSSFADDIGHRHSSPISSPILMNNNNNTNASANRFSSVVGTSLAGGGGGGRVSHPAGVDFNTSGLASSASSGSTCAGTFGAIGSRVFHSMTSETTGQSDNSQLTRPQQCSECLTQGGAAGSGACSGGGSMSGGHHMTSSTSSPIQIDSGATATGSRTSSRIFSSHSINENFSNLPQSPILLSSPFSNPGCDLERLTLRRELDEIRQRLDSKEGEVEVLKKQRDFVAEHLRDSLGVIRQLFHSLNMSSTASTDLFKPLFIDTETSMSSDQSTGGGCCPQSLSSESNPCEKFKTCMQMSPMMMVTSPSPSGPTDSFSAGGRSQLQQQQQEALTALFTNPLVSALLNTQTDISGIDASKMKSETQFPNWNPLENYPLEHQTAVHRSSKQLSNNNDNDNNDNPPYSPTTRLHTDDSDDDDDDLFSASGLLSLSNQESCELERSTTTDTNEEDSNDNNNNNNNSNTGSTTHHDEVTNTNANNSDVISTSCCGNDESSPSSSSTTEQAEQSCPATSTTTSASTATAVAAAAIAASTSLLHNLSTDSQQNNNSNNNGDKNICQSPSSSPKTSTAIEADQSTTTTTT